MFPKDTSKSPVQTLQSTLKAYPMLNKTRLTSEFNFLCSQEQFTLRCGAVDMLQLFGESGLQDAFPETVRLLKILVTTPMPSAEPERCFQTLKRIQSFLRNTITTTTITTTTTTTIQEMLNVLAMLSVERRLMTELTGFNQKVVEKFASQPRRRDAFMYR